MSIVLSDAMETRDMRWLCGLISQVYTWSIVITNIVLIRRSSSNQYHPRREVYWKALEYKKEVRK